MSPRPVIRAIRQAVEGLNVQPRVRHVSLFGSHARGNAHAQSDIDLIIEFAPPVGFFDLVRVQHALEQALHAPVDLVTPDSLSPYLREDILRDAVPVYGT